MKTGNIGQTVVNFYTADTKDISIIMYGDGYFDTTGHWIKRFKIVFDNKRYRLYEKSGHSYNKKQYSFVSLDQCKLYANALWVDDKPILEELKKIYFNSILIFKTKN